jgi:hypothetical protein
MDTLVPDVLPLYRERLGSWRPDFLIEEDSNGETFRITEINARFSFNGFLTVAYGQQALHSIGVGDGSNGLIGATDPAKAATSLPAVGVTVTNANLQPDL